MKLGRPAIVLVVLVAAPSCSKAPALPAPAVADVAGRAEPAPARSPTVGPASITKPASARPAQALDPASVAVLKSAIESKDYATRLIAIEAIGDAHAEALAGWLEHALGDPEHDVRMAAIDALDRMQTPRALGLLATVRDDTSEELDIRAVAAGALLRATSERQEVR
jgi:HEAT repeat protein